MEAITLPIYSIEGKEVGSVKLDPAVFDGKVNHAVIYQAVVAYRANQRKGLAATKTRGEVSGGGKKPWRQKGTGRARIGSIRSPLWRHGGVIFGPHPRDFSYKLPQKIRNLALRSSLNAKLKENNFLVIDEFKLDEAKTKAAAKVFANLKIMPKKPKRSFSVLLLLDKMDKHLTLALRNLDFLTAMGSKDAFAYAVMAHQKVIINKSGLDELIGRIKG